jgi:hypothetical protein
MALHCKPKALHSKPKALPLGYFVLAFQVGKGGAMPICTAVRMIENSYRSANKCKSVQWVERSKAMLPYGVMTSRDTGVVHHDRMKLFLGPGVAFSLTVRGPKLDTHCVTCDL